MSKVIQGGWPPVRTLFGGTWGPGKGFKQSCQDWNSFQVCHSVSGKITGWTEKSQGREALSVGWGKVSGPRHWECWQARKMMQAPSRDMVSHFSALQPPVPGACLVREGSLVHV